MVERRTHPEAREVEVGMQLEDIGRSWELAARERIVRDLATAGETDVSKDVAVGTADTQVLMYWYGPFVYDWRVYSAINNNV